MLSAYGEAVQRRAQYNDFHSLFQSRGTTLLLVGEMVEKSPSTVRCKPRRLLPAPPYAHIVLLQGAEKLGREDWDALKAMNPVYVGADWTFKRAPRNWVLTAPPEVIVDIG